MVQMKAVAFFILVGLMMTGCSEESVSKTDLRVVPNENPKIELQNLPNHSAASTAELLELAKKLEEQQKEQEEKTKTNRETEDETTDLPIDYRALNPDEQLETAADFRRKVLGDSLKPLPHPTTFKKMSKTESLKPGKEKPLPKKEETKEVVLRTAGAQLFEVIQKTENLSATLPPGKFFEARLIGNVVVTALADTPVFAEIYDPNGIPLGTAIGSASLHPFLHDRAFLKFGQLILETGTVTGQMEGFEADLSLGIRGQAERKTLKHVIQSVVETALGALSLEVKTEGFGDVFKVQLADRLMEQAQSRLDELDLERTVVLTRDLRFWVASTQTTNLSTEFKKPLSPHLGLSAMDVAVPVNKRKDLESAYNRLRDRMSNE